MGLGGVGPGYFELAPRDNKQAISQDDLDSDLRVERAHRIN